MATDREHQRELEATVHRLRPDEGVQALRSLMVIRLGAIERAWPHAVDESELRQYQGDARTLGRLIGIIDNGPAIKEAPQQRGE